MAEKKKRQRSLVQQINDIAFRYFDTIEDLTYGAEPDEQPTWSPRRRKVWRDSQLPAASTPFYLTEAARFVATVAKAESHKPDIGTLNLVVDARAISTDEWLMMFEEVENKSTKALLPVVDVKTEPVDGK